MSEKLNNLETLARDYSAKSKTLRNYHEELDSAIDELKAKYLDKIKEASSLAGESYQALLLAVKEAEELFQEKKSITINGVKFGFQKKKGKIEILNEEGTIKKIQELYGENANMYLNTKVSILKKTLDQLPASDLKKIGVNIVQDTSEAFVKLTDDEVQKLIEAMIKESSKVAV